MWSPRFLASELTLKSVIQLDINKNYGLPVQESDAQRCALRTFATSVVACNQHCGCDVATPSGILTFALASRLSQRDPLRVHSEAHRTATFVRRCLPSPRAGASGPEGSCSLRQFAQGGALWP